MIEEVLELSKLLPLPLIDNFPTNFLCVDLGGVCCTSEKQYQTLWPRASLSALPACFLVEEDEILVTEIHLGDSTPNLADLRTQLQGLLPGPNPTEQKKVKAARLLKLRQRLAKEQLSLEAEKEALNGDRALLVEGTQKLQDRLKDREDSINRNAQCRQQITDQRKQLLKLQFLIEARQLKLLSDLRFVYPIDRSENGHFTIRGLELPADLSTAKDEEQVASALGYVVHLLLLASKYLEQPLRYQLLFMGSRSLVRDPMLLHQDNTFPLFRKSIEKERFERAVLWLRGDIEQLLCTRGLPFDAGKPLLQNLQTLFDGELSPRLL
jgi:hypothetical protein